MCVCLWGVGDEWGVGGGEMVVKLKPEGTFFLVWVKVFCKYHQTHFETYFPTRYNLLILFLNFIY